MLGVYLEIIKNQKLTITYRPSFQDQLNCCPAISSNWMFKNLQSIQNFEECMQNQTIIFNLLTNAPLPPYIPFEIYIAIQHMKTEENTHLM